MDTSLIVGKRSHGLGVMILALTIIVLSLFFIAFKRGRPTVPQSDPMHQQR
jgi:type IV secretory pathway TrbL component